MVKIIVLAALVMLVLASVYIATGRRLMRLVKKHHKEDLDRIILSNDYLSKIVRYYDEKYGEGMGYKVAYDVLVFVVPWFTIKGVIRKITGGRA